MRYAPAALALSLAVAVTASAGLGAEQPPDPRAAALAAQGESQLAAGDIPAAVDSFRLAREAFAEADAEPTR